MTTATTTTGDAKGNTGAPPPTTPDGAKGTTGTPEGSKSLITSAVDTKADEGTGEKGKGGEAEAQETTPDFKLNVPDDVDPKSVQPWLDIAAKHKLAPEVAQEVFDLALKHGSGSAEALENEIKTTWEKTKETWINEAKTDKEIGGADLKSNLAVAHKAALRFGGEALIKALDESGLGNHPEVIRAFFRVGKMISEDSIGGTTGKGTTGSSSEKARLMKEFPNSPDMWKHLPD